MVGAHTLLKNLAPHVGLKLLLEEAANLFRALGILRLKASDEVLLDGGDGLVALGLVRHVDGSLEAWPYEVRDCLRQCSIGLWRLEGALGLARCRDELLLELDDLPDRLVTLANRLKHRLFRQLLGACLDHHHGVCCSCHDQVKLTLFQL